MVSGFFLSCFRSEPPVNNNADLEIIWKTKRDRVGLASSNYIYNDLLIQGIESTEAGFKLVAYSLDNGSIVWESQNFDGLVPFGPEHSLQYENLIVLSRWSNISVYELDSGKLVWKDELYKGNSNITLIDGWVYKSDQVNSQSSTMFRYNVRTGVKEELFTIDKAEYGSNHVPNLKMPVKWNDSLGNEILVMNNRTYGRATTSLPKMDVMAWNLTADTMYWYHEGVDAESSSSKPAIDGNRVYFYGLWHAYCIDAKNGEILWSYDAGESDGGDFNTANVLLVNDKLIVKQENDRMHAVDKLTGKRIWFNENTASSPHLLRSINDTIWFSSGDVLGIDATTGEELIQYDNDGSGYGFWSNPVIGHPTKRYIYTTDGEYVYCLDPKFM